MWILAIMIYTARYEVVLVPYMEFDSFYFCTIQKGYLSRQLGMPLVCIRESSA